MRVLFFLAAVCAVLLLGGYYALRGMGLIGPGCPAVHANLNQIVINNKLPVSLLVRLHDATTSDYRVAADNCVLFDITRLQVTVESWPGTTQGAPNCVASLFPAQLLTVYQRAGLTYCDVGRADIVSN